MRLPALGINLWQFQRHGDLFAAVRAAAVAGYGSVETVGSIPDPSALRAALDAAGITSIGRHIVLSELGALDDLKRSCAITGATHLCSSGLQVWDQRAVSDYRLAAQTLNRAGSVLNDAGIRLHYHHHEFELAPLSGTMTGIDLLLEQGDPAAWDLCVDVGWVQQAGLDPVGFLRRHRARLGYVHLRDFSLARVSCPLGRGAIDLPGIIDEVAANPRVRQAMVEQEPGIDPVADATESLAWLRRHGAW